MTMQEDLASVYGFLQHTNQGNLKKMLCDGRFTDVHLNLLIKVIRNCTEAQFCEMAEKCDFPKMKMSNNESAIRERFWKDCMDTLQSRGLLSAAPMAKAA
ncbi:MAG: hypothetical protein ABL958_18370 [Bdellovibrionia bacterium]